MNKLATLLVCCADQKGLVAALAQVLYGHGANIIDADQHTDLVAGQFFQRIKFDMAELHTDRQTLKNAIDEVAQRFNMHWKLTDPNQKKRVAIFVSKYDHCLYDLLLRQRSGELHCDIRCIVSNHETLRPVAAQFDVPYHTFPITKENKKAQEAQELELLKNNDVELVVLARYMRVLSGEFLSHYPNTVINIHHSFLPAFTGARPYQRAYERGVKLIGATAHYATADLDEGPIIDQHVVRCTHRDAIEDLVRKGRDLEKVGLAHAVRAHLEDRIIVYNNKTVVFE